MSNLKTLKNRIKSVKSTQKITKAMKMVAASKLRKARIAVENARPYGDKISEMVMDIAGDLPNGALEEKRSVLIGDGISKTHLLVVLSSDRGLCGGLNSNNVKQVKSMILDLQSQQKNVKLFCIGKKAYDQLVVKHKDLIIDTEFGVFKNDISYESALKISRKLVKLFEEGEFNICTICYSEFKSVISQKPTKQQLIPSPVEIKTSKNKNNLHSPITFEPNQEEILNQLLPKNLAIQIFNKLLENSASEQGARMAAMESASNNAGKMIKDLTLFYNRSRQANITRELIDIISGSSAAS
ncbi:MAG: F-type H+-transporting ATPase subunit gamma [Rickettsiales bacterium]|jgi:F-type H+-transporting ATPase subunit gamma